MAGRRQGFEIKSVGFGALAEQLPVMAANLGAPAGFLVVELRKILLAHQAAEGVAGKVQARIDVVQLGGREGGLVIGFALESVQGPERAEDL